MAGPHHMTDGRRYGAPVRRQVWRMLETPPGEEEQQRSGVSSFFPSSS